MQRFRRWLITAPLPLAIAVFTLIAATISGTVSLVINTAKGEVFPLFDWMFPSLFVPLLITPVVVWIFLTLVKRMEMLQEALAASVERERLLTLEMRHRLKNVYSVTAGLISLTARELPVEDFDKLPALLRDKLAALARASDATFSSTTTNDEPSGALDLGKIIGSVLSPYSSSVRIAGKPTAISAQAMTTVALTLHELATNSMKYGALSRPEGLVSVSWEREDHIVTLRWKESRGPEITAIPDRAGFGTAVIDKFMEAAGGTVTKNWLPEGLSVEIEFSDGQ